MEIGKKEFKRSSASGEGEIYSCCYLPKGEIKAVLQIAHGMNEHCLRYERFASLLAQAGYAVFANDHIGHGRSAMGHMGTMAMKEGGFDFILEDMRTLYAFAQELLGRDDLPQILFGHSMGSIAAANYAAKIGGLSALILMGTPAQNPMTSLGILMGKAVVKQKGYEASSRLITKMSGTYVDPNDIENCWLSRDQEQVKKYLADPMVSKNFAASSFVEMLKGLKYWEKKEWEKKVPDIPILLTAGGQDPIGNCGKGPKAYYERLVSSGHTKAQLKLYSGARHELLNEINKEEAERDILAFLASATAG